MTGPARWGLAWAHGPRRWSLFVIGTATIAALPIVSVLLSLTRPRGDLWQHLAGTVLPEYVLNSLALMVGVAVGVFVVGVPAAWMTTLCRFKGRRFFEWAMLLPMAFPAYVVAYAYTGLLDYAGPIQTFLRTMPGGDAGWVRLPEVRSLPGAIVMLVLVLYPYVYLLARAAFLEQSVCVLEVSRTLGCNPWQSFLRVALPLARPAIVAGVALALMESLNDFGTVQYFGVDTLVTGVFRVWRGMGDAIAAQQLASILLCFVLALIALERWSRGQRGFAHTTGRYRPLPRFQLTGWRALGAIIGCTLPVLLGFVVPAFMLIGWATANPQYWLHAGFGILLGNSFAISGAAALLAVAIALGLAYGQRTSRDLATRIGVRAATSGYAVPGAVLAVGALVPMAALDHMVAAWIEDMFGLRIGLILTGTLIAVMFAYVVRFLTVSYNVVEASLGKITRGMDEAARSLGRRPGEAMRAVHLPMMRGSLLVAAILVFVEVLKELPATLVLRPFNFDTLATRTYDLASDERLAEAAGPALAIGLIGVLPVILLARAIRTSRPGAAAAEGA